MGFSTARKMYLNGIMSDLLRNKDLIDENQMGRSVKRIIRERKETKESLPILFVSFEKFEYF